MDTQEFKNIRKHLQKTQETMARLLGISVKAIRSYEQGWRSIPAHAERQLLFLVAKKAEILKLTKHDKVKDIESVSSPKKKRC